MMPVTSAARALRGAAVRGAGAARELSVSCLAGSVRRMRTAWRKSCGRCAARPRWLPSPRAALTTSVPTRNLPTPAPSRRQRSGRRVGPRLPRGRARAGRSPCRSLHRTAPAPAWSPLRGPAAPGRPRRGDRTGRRRVVRQASRAEQPAAVSHRRWSVGLSARGPCPPRDLQVRAPRGRASKVRTPFLAMRWTSTVSAALKSRDRAFGARPDPLRPAAAPIRKPSSRSARPEVRASTASMMSSPVGSDSSSSVLSCLRVARLR